MARFVPNRRQAGVPKTNDDFANLRYSVSMLKFLGLSIHMQREIRKNFDISVTVYF